MTIEKVEEVLKEYVQEHNVGIKLTIQEPTIGGATQICISPNGAYGVGLCKWQDCKHFGNGMKKVFSHAEGDGLYRTNDSYKQCVTTEKVEGITLVATRK